MGEKSVRVDSNEHVVVAVLALARQLLLGVQAGP